MPASIADGKLPSDSPCTCSHPAEQAGFKILPDGAFTANALQPALAVLPSQLTTVNEPARALPAARRAIVSAKAKNAEQRPENTIPSRDGLTGNQDSQANTEKHFPDSTTRYAPN